MADMVSVGDTLILQKLHVSGPGAGTLGVSELRRFARVLGRQQGVRRIVVLGARRSTGASRGRIPRPIVVEVD